MNCQNDDRVGVRFFTSPLIGPKAVTFRPSVLPLRFTGPATEAVSSDGRLRARHGQHRRLDLDLHLREPRQPRQLRDSQLLVVLLLFLVQPTLTRLERKGIETRRRSARKIISTL